MKAQLKLRAGRIWDLPRLRALWRMNFPDSVSDEYFFEHCFVPDHVESSLVLLEDNMIQSVVYFLPTFWYDESDSYMPVPCLVGLSTAKDRRHKQYASWLVETACDFMVEKGAGGVWTLLPDDELELFFTMQGFWTMPEREHFIQEHDTLPEPYGVIHRGEPEDYEQVRELLLRGKNHVVYGDMVASIQRDMAERADGGMFLMDADGVLACAIATKAGNDVELQELLCPEEKREAALALLAKELPAARYTMGEHDSPCGMLRFMNKFAKMEHPQGYLGCGPML